MPSLFQQLIVAWINRLEQSSVHGIMQVAHPDHKLLLRIHSRENSSMRLRWRVFLEEFLQVLRANFAGIKMRKTRDELASALFIFFRGILRIVRCYGVQLECMAERKKTNVHE